MHSLSIFTRFPTQGASSRYRFYLYLHGLLDEDFSVDIEAFFSTAYLQEVYGEKKIRKWDILISYLKRMISLFNASDNLLIEYELFPRLPYGFEKLFLKRRRYILNYDDNVWDNYKNSQMLKSKYDHLVKNAVGVIVANDYLAQKVSALNPTMVKIPTVVDTGKYDVLVDKCEKFTIVWIGTRFTYKYIKAYADSFLKLAEKCDFRLRIIASKNLQADSIQGIDMEFLEWSSAYEAKWLAEAHVGIMPLVDDGFSVGKSAFKLIQYCAAGIPMVASDIGENKNIISHGENGFLARDHQSFTESLYAIYSDKSLYDKMSANAKASSYDFSLQKYQPIFHDFIKRCVSKEVV